MTKKRVRISNESVNSYGSRILTSGIDLKQFERNPVLLYMHERGQVIGYVKDLRVEGSEVTGELVFDEATELSQRCKKQWEFGSLKMVSVGIDIIETSESSEYVIPGQTAPTITKSKLFEVSLVDIGANDDALVLRKGIIPIGSGGGMVFEKVTSMPMLSQKNSDQGGAASHNNNHNKTTREMDLEKLALELGLAKDASEQDILAALGKLKKAAAETETVRQENVTLRASRIEGIVDGAIAENKIGADKKQQFMSLGQKIGAEELQQTFAAMSPQVKLSGIVGRGGAAGGGSSEWKKLSDVPSEDLEQLRAENPEQYKKLYKAEYGMECEI